MYCNLGLFVSPRGKASCRVIWVQGWWMEAIRACISSVDRSGDIVEKEHRPKQPIIDGPVSQTHVG